MTTWPALRRHRHPLHRPPPPSSNRQRRFPLRFDEQLKAMLKWLDDQGEIRSMNRFIEDALAQAIPAKVAAVLEASHGHSAKAAKKAAEIRKK